MFRDKFLLSTGRPFGEEPSNWIAKVTEGGFRVSLDMQKAQMKLLKAGFEHVAQTQATTSAALQGELAYQADRLGRQIAQGSSDIVTAVEQGSAEIVSSIQQMSDYLGAGLSEVRWAVERHTHVSEEILRILIESLSNESRQYFEQGFKCYETGEYEFARKTFSKALEANITNHFAYQYLGFIAVNEGNATEAIRNFDLARKFAENDYHRALALSHLARSHHATDELEKAADLAKSATETYPQLAKFWYELAGYSARLGRGEQAIKALKEAIERDWMFFTIVAGDYDFDSIHAEVNGLLDSLRERERVKARQSLDNLRQAVNTAQKCGADKEIGSWTKTLNELESQYRQGNVFLYREIVPKAKESHDKVFQIAEQILSKQIKEKQREIKQNESDRSNQISALCSTLNNLKSEANRFDSTGHKNIDFGMYVLAYILLFIPSYFGYCVYNLNTTHKHLDAFTPESWTDPFGFAVIAPIVLIIGFEFLKFLFTKAIPQWSIEQKRGQEARKVEPRKKQLEEVFDRTYKALEKELRHLETLLAKCKARQYV